MRLPDPVTLSRIIDRAYELSEQAVGHPPDRRQVAVAVLQWIRALPEGLPVRWPQTQRRS